MIYETTEIKLEGVQNNLMKVSVLVRTESENKKEFFDMLEGITDNIELNGFNATLEPSPLQMGYILYKVSAFSFISKTIDEMECRFNRIKRVIENSYI